MARLLIKAKVERKDPEESRLVNAFSEAVKAIGNNVISRNCFIDAYTTWCQRIQSNISFLNESYQLVLERTSPSALQSFFVTTFAAVCFLESLRNKNAESCFTGVFFCCLLAVMSFITAVIGLLLTTPGKPVKSILNWISTMDMFSEGISHRLARTKRMFQIIAVPDMLYTNSRETVYHTISRWSYFFRLFFLNFLYWFSIYGTVFAVQVSVILNVFSVSEMTEVLKVFSLLIIVINAFIQDIKIRRIRREIQYQTCCLDSETEKFLSWFHDRSDLGLLLKQYEFLKEPVLNTLKGGSDIDRITPSHSFILFATTMIKISDGLQDNINSETLQTILQFLLFNDPNMCSKAKVELISDKVPDIPSVLQTTKDLADCFLQLGTVLKDSDLASSKPYETTKEKKIGSVLQKTLNPNELLPGDKEPSKKYLKRSKNVSKIPKKLPGDTNRRSIGNETNRLDELSDTTDRREEENVKSEIVLKTSSKVIETGDFFSDENKQSTSLDVLSSSFKATAEKPEEIDHNLEPEVNDGDTRTTKSNIKLKEKNHNFQKAAFKMTECKDLSLEENKLLTSLDDMPSSSQSNLPKDMVLLSTLHQNALKDKNEKTNFSNDADFLLSSSTKEILNGEDKNVNSSISENTVLPSQLTRKVLGKEMNGETLSPQDDPILPSPLGQDYFTLTSFSADNVTDIELSKRPYLKGKQHKLKGIGGLKSKGQQRKRKTISRNNSVSKCPPADIFGLECNSESKGAMSFTSDYASTSHALNLSQPSIEKQESADTRHLEILNSMMQGLSIKSRNQEPSINTKSFTEINGENIFRQTGFKKEMTLNNRSHVFVFKTPQFPMKGSENPSSIRKYATVNEAHDDTALQEFLKEETEKHSIEQNSKGKQKASISNSKDFIFGLAESSIKDSGKETHSSNSFQRSLIDNFSNENKDIAGFGGQGVPKEESLRKQCVEQNSDSSACNEILVDRNSSELVRPNSRIEVLPKSFKKKKNRNKEKITYNENNLALAKEKINASSNQLVIDSQETSPVSKFKSGKEIENQTERDTRKAFQKRTLEVAFFESTIVSSRLAFDPKKDVSYSGQENESFDSEQINEPSSQERSQLRNDKGNEVRNGHTQKSVIVDSEENSLCNGQVNGPSKHQANEHFRNGGKGSSRQEGKEFSGDKENGQCSTQIHQASSDKENQSFSSDKNEPFSKKEINYPDNKQDEPLNVEERKPAADIENESCNGQGSRVARNKGHESHNGEEKVSADAKQNSELNVVKENASCNGKDNQNYCDKQNKSFASKENIPRSKDQGNQAYDNKENKIIIISEVKTRCNEKENASFDSKQNKSFNAEENATSSVQGNQNSSENENISSTSDENGSYSNTKILSHDGKHNKSFSIEENAPKNYEGNQTLSKNETKPCKSGETGPCDGIEIETPSNKENQLFNAVEKVPNNYQENNTSSSKEDKSCSFQENGLCIESDNAPSDKKQNKSDNSEENRPIDNQGNQIGNSKGDKSCNLAENASTNGKQNKCFKFEENKSRNDMGNQTLSNNEIKPGKSGETGPYNGTENATPGNKNQIFNAEENGPNDYQENKTSSNKEDESGSFQENGSCTETKNASTDRKNESINSLDNGQINDQGDQSSSSKEDKSCSTVENAATDRKQKENGPRNDMGNQTLSNNETEPCKSGETGFYNGTENATPGNKNQIFNTEENGPNDYQENKTSSNKEDESGSFQENGPCTIILSETELLSQNDGAGNDRITSRISQACTKESGKKQVMQKDQADSSPDADNLSRYNTDKPDSSPDADNLSRYNTDKPDSSPDADNLNRYNMESGKDGEEINNLTDSGFCETERIIPISQKYKRNLESNIFQSNEKELGNSFEESEGNSNWFVSNGTNTYLDHALPEANLSKLPSLKNKKSCDFKEDYFRLSEDSRLNSTQIDENANFNLEFLFDENRCHDEYNSNNKPAASPASKSTIFPASESSELLTSKHAKLFSELDKLLSSGHKECNGLNSEETSMLYKDCNLNSTQINENAVLNVDFLYHFLYHENDNHAEDHSNNEEVADQHSGTASERAEYTSETKTPEPAALPATKPAILPASLSSELLTSENAKLLTKIAELLSLKHKDCHDLNSMDTSMLLKDCNLNSTQINENADLNVDFLHNENDKHAEDHSNNEEVADQHSGTASERAEYSSETKSPETGSVNKRFRKKQKSKDRRSSGVNQDTSDSDNKCKNSTRQANWDSDLCSRINQERTFGRPVREVSASKCDDNESHNDVIADPYSGTKFKGAEFSSSSKSCIARVNTSENGAAILGQNRMIPEQSEGFYTRDQAPVCSLRYKKLNVDIFPPLSRLNLKLVCQDRKYQTNCENDGSGISETSSASQSMNPEDGFTSETQSDDNLTEQNVSLTPVSECSGVIKKCNGSKPLHFEDRNVSLNYQKQSGSLKYTHSSDGNQITFKSKNTELSLKTESNN